MRPFAANLANKEQYFGQMFMRKDPRYYLLTRYFVMCLNTGALHTYRFRNADNYSTLFADLNRPNYFEFKYNCTLGYLARYLEDIWHLQGKPRE